MPDNIPQDIYFDRSIEAIYKKVGAVLKNIHGGSGYTPVENAYQDCAAVLFERTVENGLRTAYQEAFENIVDAAKRACSIGDPLYEAIREEERQLKDIGRERRLL